MFVTLLFILAYHLPCRKNLDVHGDRFGTGRGANVYVHVGLRGLENIALESKFSEYACSHHIAPAQL